jgi:hypothetical protein
VRAGNQLLIKKCSCSCGPLTSVQRHGLQDGRNAKVNSSILVFVQKLFVPSNYEAELTLLLVSSLKPSPVLATKVLVRDGKDQHYFLKKKDMSSHFTNDN